MADQCAPLVNDLILRTARGEKVERPPAWVMRQAGRYLPEYLEITKNKDFFQCCRSPELSSEISLLPLRRYGSLLDAVIIFSDILIIPQALGMEVVMVPKQGPRFPNPLESPDDQQYAAILNREVTIAEELDYVYKAITLTRLKINGQVPLIGFCGAPWTLLCYMVEGGGSKMFKQIKTWVYKYPNETKAILTKITDCCVEHLAQQVKAGAQIYQVFDSSAGELPPLQYAEFSLPYLKTIPGRVSARLQELGVENVPSIVFAKGACHALESFCDSDYDVISLDWLHEPAKARDLAQKHGKVLQGNADPGVLYGTQDKITQTVEHMVEGFWRGRSSGWIANLGHGITPFVDPDALKFFFEEIRRLST